MAAVLGALIALLLCTIAYQAYVSVRVARFEGYDHRQKLLQLFVIWLVPFFGALFAHFILHTTVAPSDEADRHFTPDEKGAD